MPEWKLDLIFESRGRGWRETYYANFDTTNFQGMLPFAQKLAIARIALCAAPVQIKAYAVSDPITSGKQGQTFYFPVRYSAPTWAGNDGATDPATAVNVEFLHAATNGTRQIQMRGCPDGLINDYGELTGALKGAWDLKFADWRAVVLGQGQAPGNASYGWFSRLPMAVDPGRVTYAYTPGAHIPTLTFPTDFFDADSEGKTRYIRIRGVNGGTSRLNGEQVVFVTSRNTAEPVKPIGLGPMISAGMAQRYAVLPTFVVANNVGVKKVGTRKPGAPLGYTPGRRRAVPRT